MTARVTELFKSREGVTALEPKKSSGELIFLVRDATSEDDATAAALGVCSATWNGMQLRAIKLEHVAHNKWVCRATYDDQEEELNVGEWRLSFDTTCGTVKKTVSLAQRRYPDIAGRAQIGVNIQDGKVQGVDWPVGQLKFTITFRQPQAVITLPYARACAALVGRTNDDDFYGFGPNELLFLGCRGQQGSKVDPSLDYDFLAGEEIGPVELGGIIVGQKKAHEFLWAAFEDAVATGGTPELVQKPKAIYVEQMAEEGDFSQLLIGTGS
jgi:hypothetical protein